MSELRIKFLELALKGGATIENATKVAAAWEQWATEDDPLRLGVPDVKATENPGKKEQKINWSRPQLLQDWMTGSIFENDGNALSADEFTGRAVGSKNWKTLSKYDFVYHGEIPQEQPMEEKTTGLSFMEAITACNSGETITRPPWREGRCMYQSNAGLRWGVGYGATLRMEDFLATDWKIVNP